LNQRENQENEVDDEAYA